MKEQGIRVLEKIIKKYFLFFVIFSMSASQALAEDVPNQFGADTIISSSKMNANFKNLSDRSWEKTGSNLHYSGGNVGIGTTNPGSKLEVNGNIEATGVTISGTPVGTSTDTYWSTAQGGDIQYSGGNVHATKFKGAMDTIFCSQSGDKNGARGGYTFDFTVADCGGALPDSNYIGMGVHMGICNGFVTWDVNQAPTPGVRIYSGLGPCGTYRFSALYVRVK